MRVPGIKNIACAPASSIPADVELKAVAGIVPDLSGIQFTPVAFVGEPVCDVEQSNKHNGSASSVVLSFVSTRRLDFRRHVWVVWTVDGGMYLIGSRDSIPSFKCKDSTAGASSANHAEVTVELLSPCAWICMGNVIPSESGGSVIFETWREITEEEIDNIINNLH